MSENTAKQGSAVQVSAVQVSAVQVSAVSGSVIDSGLPTPQPRDPVVVNVKTLLDAGAHFGHQSHRWNPQMLPYIYGEKNGIHIINLDLTVKAWEKAKKAIIDTAARGGSILFVGTKHQARDVVREEAVRCGGHFVTDRWLGGTLSNFQTIRSAIERMKKHEDLLFQAEQEGTKVKIVKRERVTIKKELVKLQASLGGIREMRKVPDIVVVTDVVKEAIAVAECRKLHIPVLGLVDTNADPHLVNFPIPANDDAPRVLKLFLAAAADAAMEGRKRYDAAMSANQSESRGGNGGGGGGRRRTVETRENPTVSEATAN